MSENSTILVTGGTGTTGSRLATRLADLGFPVRTAGRRPGHPDPGTSREHVHFDWADPATHAPALDGVGRLYLVAPVSVTDPAPVMLPFLRQARAAGVERAVLLSASAIAEGDAGLGQVHQAVRDQFPAWAVLQPAWFMQNFVGDHPHARSIRETDEIVTATGDGGVGFVDAHDIAEVAVRALTNAAPHNTAHLITGPEALSYADIAATIATHTGRPVRHRAVSPAAMRDHLTASGIPSRFAELLASLDEAVSWGGEDRTSPAVERVTGRPPRSFVEFARAHADAWERS